MRPNAFTLNALEPIRTAIPIQPEKSFRPVPSVADVTKKVPPAGDGGNEIVWTVKVATPLVTEPAALVTTHCNWVPLSEIAVAGVV